MTLWNIIRDYFVQNLFGGYLSDGTFISDNILGGSNNTSNVTFQLDGWLNGGSPFNISVGDWLSTTATIIVLIVLIFVLALSVRWIFRVFASAFRGR